MPAAFVIFGEAEAVGAYDGSILKQNVVAQVTEFSYHRMSVGEEIVADGCSAIDNDVGQKDSIVSDDGIFVDYHIRTKMRVLAELRLGIDYGSGMNTGSIGGRPIEQLDGFGPGQIGVAAAQHSRVNGGEVFGDDDGGRLGDLRGGVVLRIGDEGELAGRGVFYAGYSGDFGFGSCIVDLGVQGLGNVG